MMCRFNCGRLGTIAARGVHLRQVLVETPRPGISKPECRQHMKRRGLRAAVRDANANHYIVRSYLGVLNVNIEVAVLCKDAGVDKLEFWLILSPVLVFVDEIAVWKCSLGILIE